MKENNNYLIISSQILHDKKLTPLDRLIFALITSLDKADGCYASNKTLARYANCSVSSVSKSVSKLMMLHYIVSNKSNGRSCVRKVNQKFKNDESKSDNLLDRHRKNDRHPIKNGEHIYKENNKEQNKIYLNSDIDDEQIIKSILKLPYDNPIKFYRRCKECYSDIYSIEWDKETVSDFGELISKTYKTFKKDIELFAHGQLSMGDDISLRTKKILKNRIAYHKVEMNFFFNLFSEIIKNPLDFFKNELPRTFMRFWNEVIHQKRIKKIVSEAKAWFPDTGNSFT